MLRTCERCGSLAMFLIELPSGQQCTICHSCLDAGAVPCTTVRTPCTVSGCCATPKFIVEETGPVLQVLALCEAHFKTYTGMISQAIRLPWASVNDIAMTQSLIGSFSRPSGEREHPESVRREGQEDVCTPID